jgi:hypothetical protein
MNILVVNFDKNFNYGGVLQGWALQHVLESMGHTVVKAEVPLPSKYPKQKLHLLWNIAKRIRRKYLIGDKSIEILREFRENDIQYIPHKDVMRFMKSHINTVTVNSLNELNGNDYDAVIVGSDQVWRKKYMRNHSFLSNKSVSDNTFLAFTDNWHCKRIAYAASIGVDYWEYTDTETEVIRPLIQKFDAISVREDSAIKLLHENLDPTLNIEHVLDPTLLIDKKEYQKLLHKNSEQSHNGEILIYILDQTKEKDDMIECIKNEVKLNSFCANNPKYLQLHLKPEERIQNSITSWLRGFNDASLMITDSYHGCVFSIIFEKPFYVILNEVRGTARIMSLLKIFNLTERIIRSKEDIITINKDINWERVREIKKQWQVKSLAFLQNALG